MILYVNCCITSNVTSRTLRIAENFLAELKAKNSTEAFQTVDLRNENLPFLNSESLRKRDRILESGEFSNPMLNFAHQFAEANQIIIAAPYWDLSFPAALKAYFEQISVKDITFCADSSNKLVGVCHAKRLIFITTAGGFVEDRNFGGEYIKGLCDFFGIPEFYEVLADGLDLPETNIEETIEAAGKKLNLLL